MATSNAQRPSVTTTSTLGAIGIGGVIFFAIIVVLFHVIERDLNPIERFVSDYANGRAGWLQGIAFILFGSGIMAIAVGLYRELHQARRATAAAVLVGMMGLGVFLSGIFPTDVPLEDGTTGYTFAGQMHDIAGILGFLCLIVGTFLLRGVFARDPRWQSLARPARWFSWGILIGMIVFVVVGEIANLVGVLQRIWLIIVAAWLLLLAFHLRDLDADSTDDSVDSEPIQRAG